MTEATCSVKACKKPPTLSRTVPVVIGGEGSRFGARRREMAIVLPFCADHFRELPANVALEAQIAQG
jgi:hypothetical protein